MHDLYLLCCVLFLCESRSFQSVAAVLCISSNPPPDIDMITVYCIDTQIAYECLNAH